MGFQTPQYKLAKLLEDVGDGTIQLPDFQRGYKWDEEHIRSLLVTITLNRRARSMPSLVSPSGPERCSLTGGGTTPRPPSRPRG